jgi:hypothetical protein
MRTEELDELTHFFADDPEPQPRSGQFQPLY